MNNKLVNFLAQVGADASLQQPEALKQAAQMAGLTEKQIEALLLKQHQELAVELNLRKDIVCFMVPAEEEQEGDQTNEEDDDDAQNASIKIA